MFRTAATATFTVAFALTLSACGDNRETDTKGSPPPAQAPSPAITGSTAPAPKVNTELPAISDAEMAKKAPPPTEAQLNDVEPATAATNARPETVVKPESSSSPPVAGKANKAAASAGRQGPVLTQDQALALAAKGNCLLCHKIEAKLVGPAWQWVGDKYKDDPNGAATIATNIRSGGSFGWKFGVMPPRGGGKLSDADVEALAGFIATLRK